MNAFKDTRRLGVDPRRFFSHVERQENGCMVWTAARDAHGYGRVGRNVGGWVFAHRWSYEFHKGAIPDGLVLDHLCRNPPCVNPDHLEPVTSKVNTHRGVGHGHETACPRGHDYSAANTYVSGGKRYCRACNRESHARRSAARRVSP